MLRVQLLGGFALAYNDTPVLSVKTARLQSLLTYLILHRDTPQSRQHMAFLLWPDTHEARARNNLRQFLYQLRQTLPNSDRFVATDSNTVCWQTREAQLIDVDIFERLLVEAEAAESRGDTSSQRRALEQALTHYQGDLLPSCYEEWIAPERERLHRQYLLAHEKLAQVLEQQRDYAAALQMAHTLLRLDPLDERTYTLLMRLHVLNHDRAGALRVYQIAQDTLERELGVKPGAALRNSYERLLNMPEASQALDALPSATPLLIGRQVEWQRLQAAWQQAAKGHALLALVKGEAGIGKTRLAEELVAWAARQGIRTAKTRSYAAEGQLSLAPVTDWLRSNTLRPGLAQLDALWLTEAARLLPELLAEHPNLPRPEPIAEYGQRQRFFEGLAHAVANTQNPTLLLIDDLQWCDQETLEWLHFLLRSVPQAPLLIVGTARSEDLTQGALMQTLQHLRVAERIVEIELPPLDAAETGKLAAQITGRELDTSATMHLYQETEGNPLFIVEMVQAGGSWISTEQTAPDASSRLDSASRQAGQARRLDTLPPRLQAVVAGRLASLSPLAHKVAEIAAVTGRGFTLDMLLHASREDEEKVVSALDELWQKRIISEQDAGAYDFTHDKLREVAYAEISVPQRRLLHHRIAQVLQAIHADHLDLFSGEVAAHLEQAGMLAEAIPYCQRAAAVAAGVYANADAIALLRRGLSLLQQLPPDAKRDAQELAMQLALSPLYRITLGWTAPEVEQGLSRSLVLCDKVGNAAQRAQTLYGLQSLYVVQARLEKVHYTYDEMRQLFMQTQGSTPPFAGLMYTGAQLHMGRLVEASETFEKIVATRDPQRVRDLQESQGVNYLAHGHAWNSHALWCLGYPQRALESGREAVQIAREFAQPFNQALTITYLAMLQEMCADAATFQAQAEEAIALTREYQAPYYYAWANILAHFARAGSQPDAGSIARLRDVINVFSETGARLRLPYYLSLLARTCGKAGHFDEGLAVIEQALAESLQNNERWWDAELHRLRGELMLARGADSSDVEGAFRRAIGIAQSQRAKSLELRASTSLARLWRGQGCAVEARQLLAPVFTWFTQGQDTPDLRDAQALLAQL